MKTNPSVSTASSAAGSISRVNPGAGVGTCAWALAGGPPLTLGERLRLLGESTLELLEQFPDELRLWLGRSKPVPIIEIPRLPDTSVVMRAQDELRRCGQGHQAMIDHSYRCFYFASCCAAIEQLEESADLELLAVAMLLHDVGLFETTVAEQPEVNEFTVRSATTARAIAAEAGWDPERLDVLTQAITANANARVLRESWGLEASYGRMAPVMDGLGQTWRLHPDQLEWIFERYPLGELASSVAELVEAEARRQPGGRFALYKAFFVPMVKMRSRRWAKLG